MVNAEEKSGTARTVVISSEEAGQRIDNYLLAQLKGVPRSLIYRIVRSGEVRINSGRVRPSQRLIADDRVRIPPLRVADRTPANPDKDLLERVPGWILYEDSTLLAVNKPSGLAVHGGSGLRFGLIEALRASRPQAPYLELVHRLDRDTSGCILIAKRRSMLRYLHEALREGRVAKHYFALVAGRWPKRRTKVNAALAKDLMRAGERVVRAVSTGRAAETRFQVLTRYPLCTLVDAAPVTGRTHQIRVHAQSAGHPLAGDPKYGDREFNRLMRESGLRRLFLHASTLSFADAQARRIDIEAPLDPELRVVLERLGGSRKENAVHI